MDFGVGYFPTHDGMGPGAVARLVEEHGQDALFFAEHTHIPADAPRRDDGQPLPPKYWHCYDLFVALTAAAAATTRLRVGSGWHRGEMANHGTDPRTRMALMRERVEAMRAIWTQAEASYHGKYVSFDRILS